MNWKLFLAIFISAFALIPLSDPVFKSLASKGITTRIIINSRDVSLCTMFQFLMFMLMGFSIVPLALKFFIFGQTKIGSVNLPFIKFLQAHEQGVVYCLWGLLIFGFCIALPGSIKEGFFD